MLKTGDSYHDFKPINDFSSKREEAGLQETSIYHQEAQKIYDTSLETFQNLEFINGHDEPDIRLDELHSNEIGLSFESTAISETIEKFVNMHLLERKPDELDKERFQRTFEFLIDPDRKIREESPRLELHAVSKEQQDLFSSIDLVFANEGSANSPSLKKEEFLEQNSNSPLLLMASGNATIKIRTPEVNTATALHYISQNLKEITIQSGYTPGALIDAQKTNSFLCLNYDVFSEQVDDPSTQEKILDYLRAGGILVAYSNNELEKIVKKVLAGIPDYERSDILSHIFVVSDGGGSLAVFEKNGELRGIRDYQEKGLSAQKTPQRVSDYVDIGEDLNDISLKGFVDQITKKAAFHPTSPLFSDVPSLKSAANYTPAADKIVQETLERAERVGVNNLLVFCEQELNAPVRYEKEKIDDLIQTFHALRQDYSLKEVAGKEKVVLDFEGLLNFEKKFREKLSEKNKNPDDYHLVNNWEDGTLSFEEKMEKALDQMHLKDHDVVRLLEPGNNDQATPMFVAQQAKFILDYAEKKGLSLNVQVLVMGKGGHATTEIFPQFAELKGKDFSGTREAESLGETLKNALIEQDIEVEYDIEKFSDTPGKKVQIKLAKESTNTGENVDEASAAYEQGINKPRHIFICSATPSSTRQAQTFAQQYSDNRADPLREKKYDSIIAIPPTKSREFIEKALNDHQAVTELYDSLAEMGRLYAYAFNLDGPYIPAAPINVEHLEKFYQAYDQLSGTNDLEKSKKEPIQKLLAFFQSKFQTMEGSIVWSKEKSLQSTATKEAMRQLTGLYRKKTNLERSIKLYHELEGKHLDEADQKIMQRYEILFKHSMASTTSDREKFVSLTMMSRMVKKLETIKKKYS